MQVLIFISKYISYKPVIKKAPCKYFDLQEAFSSSSDPGEARTLDPMIKSHLLYQLSYGVILLFFLQICGGKSNAYIFFMQVFCCFFVLLFTRVTLTHCMIRFLPNIVYN